jgi:DNA polymerase
MFIDADFSSVENRVAAWIAGQQDKLDMFAKGLDEYKVFASGSLYRVPYDEVTKDQRQVSKSAVLGSMFGQGWKGLIEFAEGYGVELSEERSQAIVAAYREEYSELPKTWYACGDAMLQACRAPGAIVQVGKLQFVVREKFLKLKLPSERVLYWYDPKIEERETPWGAMRDAVVTWSVNSVTRKWERRALIGSSAFQSAVQGTARDLLVHGVKNLEQADYGVVLRVHDEALAEVDLIEDTTTLEAEFCRLLCQAPSWAAGLPLTAEAWTGERFRK